ncbi:hypothetical protein E4K72_19075 [Oxalobacteraceae bacterium OM1]|nr:hypothetical protein E4K72_19075 [Oxalobacteraceae bacterium OM1]
MNPSLTTCIAFAGLAIAGCSGKEKVSARPVTQLHETTSAGSAPNVSASFPYKAYPKTVLVQYDDKDAYLRANRLRVAQGLPFWDNSVLQQYEADLAVVRQQILGAWIGNGIKIIAASSVVPQATLQVSSKEALEWLYANPAITRIWLNANPVVVPSGEAPTAR